MTQTQFCSHCYHSLPLTEFSTYKYFNKTIQQTKTALSKVCKSCTSARKARWRASHPSYMATYHKAMKEPPVLLVCHNCGQPFENTNPMQKLCRSDCRKQTITEEYKQWRLSFPGVSKEVFKRMILQKLKT
jgi:hypothetical protein